MQVSRIQEAHAIVRRATWPREVAAVRLLLYPCVNGSKHALLLYLDTSVIGGYHDPEFMTNTRALWRLREEGHLRFATSRLVFQEIARAPRRVQELMRATFQAEDVLPRTAEVE